MCSNILSHLLYKRSALHAIKNSPSKWGYLQSWAWGQFLYLSRQEWTQYCLKWKRENGAMKKEIRFVNIQRFFKFQLKFVSKFEIRIKELNLTFFEYLSFQSLLWLEVRLPPANYRALDSAHASLRPTPCWCWPRCPRGRGWPSCRCRCCSLPLSDTRRRG